ncbi:MAG: hypothetical protein GY903_08765 [Fuerstiella sp.]|nr:hypothetical protein [Fuerstiella sp.]MCP4854572.1 hypothetical protein [Fuerstiella sp.]
MTTTTTIRRSQNQQNKSFRNFMWVSMLMSLAVVFFGMQLMMVGPLKGRLDGIQTRLDLADEHLNRIVGTRDNVWEANDLLSSLQDQHNKLADLRIGMTRIGDLRRSVTKESESATAALSALDRMAAVQKRIIASRQQTDEAFGQVANLESLRDNILSGSGQTDVADNSLNGMLALQKRVIAASNGYEQASTSIASLTELTQRMIASNADLQLASKKFDEFVGLQNRMIAAADIFEKADAGFASAQESASKLAALKDQILSTTDNVDVAQGNARTMVAMNETLSGGLNLTVAAANLDQMIQLQDSLGEQTIKVASAIQTLEILDDFQAEVSTHVRSLTGLRRTLVELAMMESTVGRVAQVMAPLTELSSLRRLGESEIREAARVIMNRRNTRLTHNGASPESEDVQESEEIQEDLVPLPPEARELQ